MKVVAFLPVKGVSTRIKNKNLSLLDGKPLFIHTLEKLVDSQLFDEVYLDTESDKVVEAAKEIQCKILRRDPALATNDTDGNQLFANQIAHAEADIYVQVLCTSPFISIETIKLGIERITQDPAYDSAVLVRKEKLYTWQDGSPDYNINEIPNSGSLADTTIETMGLYIVKDHTAKKLKRRVGAQPYFMNASPLEAIDVNWPEDFALASLIAAGLREEKSRLLRNIKSRASSAILSDVLDDLGYPNQVFNGLSPIRNGAKLLGRAKTLRLRKLRDGEDFTGIYEAYKSYESVITNDIVVVESETPEFAYFGELNANLAIRAGASGAILGCKTRDSSHVPDIDFHVFSTGFCAQDVRKRATVDSINKPIKIQGVSITPGELIFADSEGVVVIPKEIETKTLQEISTKLTVEDNILSGIAKGEPIGELLQKYGSF
ncbi:MAG: cytidyltransferase [Legionellales bacterium]|nr:cytidyltransferase [Legionellales bacterium]